MRSPLLPLLAIAILAGLAACAEAGGEVKGGELTDSGALATEAPFFDKPPENVGEGSTWHDLYRDIFGPTGRPGSCSFKTSCHGTAEGAGAIFGSGIKCFDEEGCYQSFLTGQVKAADSKAPEKSNLFGVLRFQKADGKLAGIMPKEPATFYFPGKSRLRITEWIQNGCPKTDRELDAGTSTCALPK